MKQIEQYFEQTGEKPNQLDVELMKTYADQLSLNEIVPKECVEPLINKAMNRQVEGIDFWNVGKHLQISAPFGAIDFKCENEVVAGYWAWLKHHYAKQVNPNTQQS